MLTSFDAMAEPLAASVMSLTFIASFIACIGDELLLPPKMRARGSKVVPIQIMVAVTVLKCPDYQGVLF